MRPNEYRQAYQADATLIDAIEEAHAVTQSIRLQYGQNRIKLGLMLHTIQQARLWVGKAESFSQYLEDLRLNSSAARQYMAVARTFILEHQVSETVLEGLAMCNMGVLYEASKVVTTENLDEIVSSLLVLHQRDALQGLKEMSPAYEHDRDPPYVNRLVSQFYDLPDDLRIAVINRICHSSAAPGRSA